MATTRNRVRTEELLTEAMSGRHQNVTELAEHFGVKKNSIKLRLVSLRKTFPKPFLAPVTQEKLARFFQDERKTQNPTNIQSILAQASGMSLQDYEQAIEKELSTQAKEQGKTTDELQQELDSISAKQRKPRKSTGGKVGRPAKVKP